ncbi:MAG TPA: DUF4167 domain-containing protein [Bradyrhizobium sp.]|nr:DUF4167 domain-containing protein [Bradyrhizobium sp.]
MRGRNPGRKGPNPLTRSYESNGPDVKVRGTAQHVAEKYLQLARDAQSSGDHVMAESYLQHAEHYFRIIAAAQQAQQQAQMGGTPRPPGETDEDNDDDVDYGLSDRFASVAERLPPQPVYQAQNFQPPQPQGSFGGQPQPYGERPRFNNNDRQERQNSGDRPNYNGGDRNERWRNDRQPQERPYQDRSYQDRNAERGNYQGQRYQDRGDQRRFRGDRPERPEGQNEGEGRRTPNDREPAELPAFITAPGPRPPLSEAESSPQGQPAREFSGEGEGFHLRSRRRRRGGPRAEGSPNDVPDADEVPAGE